LDLAKDQAIGALVLIVCLAGILIYGCLVFDIVPGWNFSKIVLQITGFVAILGILGIGAWIGWTMATTPPPKPIEELEKEIEAEEPKKEEKQEPAATEQKETESPKKE